MTMALRRLCLKKTCVYFSPPRAWKGLARYVSSVAQFLALHGRKIHFLNQMENSLNGNPRKLYSLLSGKAEWGATVFKQLGALFLQRTSEAICINGTPS